MVTTPFNKSKQVFALSTTNPLAHEDSDYHFVGTIFKQGFW